MRHRIRVDFSIDQLDDPVGQLEIRGIMSNDDDTLARDPSSLQHLIEK
jgi:hypothetical protein